MDWGIKNRLSKLIKQDGRCFFLPIDHGYFQGPTNCLEKPGKTIARFWTIATPYLSQGECLRSCVGETLDKPIILRVSGGTSMAGKDLANRRAHDVDRRNNKAQRFFGGRIRVRR